MILGQDIEIKAGLYTGTLGKIVAIITGVDNYYKVFVYSIDKTIGYDGSEIIGIL